MSWPVHMQVRKRSRTTADGSDDEGSESGDDGSVQRPRKKYRGVTWQAVRGQAWC